MAYSEGYWIDLNETVNHAGVKQIVSSLSVLMQIKFLTRVIIWHSLEHSVFIISFIVFVHEGASEIYPEGV